MLPSVPGRLYQPSITRLPSLLSLLVVTLSLIALTELACRRLPSTRNTGILPVLEGKVSRRFASGHVDPRNPGPNAQQEPAPSQGNRSIALDASSTAHPVDSPVTATAASSNRLPVVESTAPVSNFLPIQQSPTPGPAPSEFLPIYGGPTSAPDPSNFLPIQESTTLVAAPSDFLPIQESTTSAAAASDFLPIHDAPTATAVPSDSLPIHGGPTSTPDPSNFLPIQESTTSAAAPSDFLPIHDAPTSAPSPSNFLPIHGPSTSVPDPAPSPPNFLPIGKASSAAQSNFLPVTHQPSFFSPDAAHRSNFLSVSAAPPNSLPVAESTAAASDFLPVHEASTGTPASSNFLPISGGFLTIASAKSAHEGVVVSETPVPVEAPPPSQFLPISTTDAFEGGTTIVPSSDFLPIQGTNIPASQPAIPTATVSAAAESAFLPNQGTSSPTVTRGIPLSLADVLVGTTAPAAKTGIFHGESFSIGSSGIVVIGGTTFTTATPTSATLANGKVVVVGPNGSILIHNSAEITTPLAQTGMFQGESFSIGSNGIVVIDGKTFTTDTPTTATLADGKVVVVGPNGSILVQNPITPTPLAQTGMFQGEPFSIGSGGVVIIDGKTFTTATPTTATLGDGKVVVVWPSGSVSVQSPQDRGPGKKSYVTPREYLIGALLPTLLAVLFSIPWHLLASAVKEIEPFYQLQRPDGIAAEDSITLDYRASLTVVATFIALRKGHFLVLWSGLISLMVLVVAPLAAETVFIGFAGECTATSGRNACSANLSVSLQAARVLQGILSFIAILTLALAIGIFRKKSGVYANPLSIAGLATLFQNSQVVERFRRLNPYLTSSKMIRSALQGHRYRISFYKDDDGTQSYGFVMCHQDSGTMQTNFRTAFRGGKKYASVAVTAVEENSRPKPQKTFSSYFVHPASIIVFALFVVGLEVLIIYFNKTGGNTAFERFMDSQSFGVSFLFTALGVMSKMYWSLLDDEIRNMEPYRQLLAGGVKASDSILLAPHTNPFTGIFYSLRNGHFFNAYISLVAILCEPLIVALSNIPFKAGLAFTTYQASTYISDGVLSMMLLGIIWMLCRKRTPALVRKPDTIASVLLFLCGSSMREDFKDMALMDPRARDAVVKRWDKNYAMGSVIGVDGTEREGIDETLFVVATAK